MVFKAGDILFGKIRPYFHKVVVAPTDGVASSDTIIIVPTDNAVQALILLTVSSVDFVASASMKSQGSKMPRADWKSLANFPIAIPTADVLRSFETVTGRWIAEIRRLVLVNHTLQRMRDILIPQLVTGRRRLR